jgi:hypothetical protein
MRFVEIKRVALSACFLPSSLPLLQPLKSQLSLSLSLPTYKNEKCLSYDKNKNKNKPREELASLPFDEILRKRGGISGTRCIKIILSQE